MRDTVNLTNTWQKIADGPCIVSIEKSGSGTILFNETATDVDARPTFPQQSTQFEQTQNRETWARTLGAGWSLLVDEGDVTMPLTADNTNITADNTNITADQTEF